MDDNDFRYSSISSSNSKLIRSAVASLVLNIIIVLSEITTPPENALEIYKDCFSVTQVINQCILVAWNTFTLNDKSFAYIIYFFIFLVHTFIHSVQNMLFSEQESVDTIVRSVLAVGTAIITTADILKTRYFRFHSTHSFIHLFTLSVPLCITAYYTYIHTYIHTHTPTHHESNLLILPPSATVFNYL